MSLPQHQKAQDNSPGIKKEVKGLRCGVSPPLSTEKLRVLARGGSNKWLLILILITSFTLNFWGIDWGLPERWHPDEMVDKAELMYELRIPDHNYHAYGSLPFYQIVMLAVWPVDIWQEWFGWHSFEVRTMNTWWARFISVVMATGVVWLVYGVGSKLFDRKSALISAGLMGVSMGLVNLAHFATADIPSLFWSMLAAYFSVRAWQDGKRRDYILAGVFAGMAAAVRFVGGILILSLLMAHWLRKKEGRSIDNLVFGVLASVIMFMIGDGAMFFSPCTFMIGFIKENFFDALRNAEGYRAFTPLIVEYINSAGWPIAVLSGAGFIFALWLVWKPRYRKQVLLIMSMVVPYYVIIGGMRVSNLRYTVPLLPFALLLVGKMFSDFIQQLPVFQKLVWKLILVSTFMYSLVYVAMADMSFTRDSRYLLQEWLRDNIYAGDSLEVTSYASDTAHWFYNVTYRPHDNAEWSTRRALQGNDLYKQTLKKAMSIESWAKNYGICPKEIPTYVSWNETAVIGHNNDLSVFDAGPQGLLKRSPNWVIISDIYYKRFVNGDESKEGKFFKQLMSGELPYVLVHEFNQEERLGVIPKVEFANPRLLIYKKQDNKNY